MIELFKHLIFSVILTPEFISLTTVALLAKREFRIKQKYDLVSKIFGWRNDTRRGSQFYFYLNQIPVVFGNCSSVMEAYNKCVNAAQPENAEKLDLKEQTINDLLIEIAIESGYVSKDEAARLVPIVAFDVRTGK